MAESVSVHFEMAGWDDLVPWLDARAVRTQERQWSYPALDYLLLLYEYSDHRIEYARDELEQMCGLLGGFPSAALCLELRRSRGNLACDAAASLALELLEQFRGIADDEERFWTLADLLSGLRRPHGRFLDRLRTRPYR